MVFKPYTVGNWFYITLLTFVDLHYITPLTLFYLLRCCTYCINLLISYVTSLVKKLPYVLTLLCNNYYADQ